MASIMTNRRIGLVLATTALAWVGFYIHNVADLPGQILLSPETGFPTLVTLVILLVWWRFPYMRATTWVLLGWALLNLIGGILSVLPLSFLPFYPEQSLRHYLFHAIYALTQLPLIGVLVSQLRQAHA